MRHLLPSVCVVLSLGCVTFGGLWWRSEDRLHKLQSEMSKPSDAAYEQLALETKAKYEYVFVEHLRSLSTPVTIHFPDHRCVELRPRWGVAGGTAVYCFTNASKRLIVHHDIGE